MSLIILCQYNDVIINESNKELQFHYGFCLNTPDTCLVKHYVFVNT